MGKGFSLIEKLILKVFLLVIGGYVLLVIVYSIPVGRISKHVGESAAIFEREGLYPYLTDGFADSRLDNWTDALMLLMAAHEDTQNGLFKQVAQSAYSEVPGKNPVETLIGIYADGSEKIDISYGRYWHGYLVFLKPLLFFFNYGEIRYLNAAFQLALICLVMYLLTKRNRAQYGIALCFYVLSLNPAALAMSMQFSGVFILTVLSCIVLLLRERQYEENTGSVIAHFLIVGCLTSYFDLLTYPLHTLAVPLVLWLSVSDRERYKTAIESALAWAAGYAGMWSGKWIISSLITGNNVIKDAFDQAVLRSSYVASDAHFTYADILGGVFDAFNNQIAFLALMVSLVYIAVCIGKHKMRVNVKLLVLLGGIALMPFCWYAVLANHSYWHSWFTFRELCISTFAVQMAIVSCNMDCQISANRTEI